MQLRPTVGQFLKLNWAINTESDKINMDEGGKWPRFRELFGHSAQATLDAIAVGLR